MTWVFYAALGLLGIAYMWAGTAVRESILKDAYADGWKLSLTGLWFIAIFGVLLWPLYVAFYIGVYGIYILAYIVREIFVSDRVFQMQEEIEKREERERKAQEANREAFRKEIENDLDEYLKD